jgi:hypothetical protein
MAAASAAVPPFANTSRAAKTAVGSSATIAENNIDGGTLGKITLDAFSMAEQDDNKLIAKKRTAH